MVPAPITVLLVDDSPAVCQALGWALEEAADLVVVGQAQEGDQALRRAAELRPDAVILDIELPRKDGFSVARALKASSHPPVVIFLSVHNDPWSRQLAAEAGADAFAEKGLGWAVLIGQIRKSITLRRQDGTRAG